MTKVSYVVKTNNGGAVKTESYPKAMEVKNNLQTMGNVVTIETVYEPVREKCGAISEKRKEWIRNRFTGNK